MSCSANRLKKLIQVGLAAPLAERLGLPTAEAGDLLEKVFQQSEYPANVDPAILSKAKQTARAYCDSLFSMAEKSGYQLGHKGSQPTVNRPWVMLTSGVPSKPLTIPPRSRHWLKKLPVRNME